MAELILIGSLTLTAFISTNFDNRILLAVLSGHTKQQRRNVMWSYAAAMITVASIGLALFAEPPEPLSYVIVATLVSASFAWFGLATLIVRHPTAEEILKRLERWLVPFLLIGIGIYILLDTTTDTLT